MICFFHDCRQGSDRPPQVLTRIITLQGKDNNDPDSLFPCLGAAYTDVNVFVREELPRLKIKSLFQTSHFFLGI